jgi:hypothetical protein
MKSHPQIMPRFLTSKNSENPCPGLVLRDYLPFFTHSIRRRPYIDICIKIDGRVRLLIEVKAANQPLRDGHIDQAQAYAAQNNYQWVVLTNGVDWHLYHLTFDEGIEYERAFVVSLADDANFDEAAQCLSILHKLSIRKGEREEFWEKAAALDSSSIGKALFSEDVLMRIRREIRKETGLLIDREDLAKSIHEMLSIEAREKIGPLRIRKRRRPSRKASSSQQEQFSISEEPEENEEKQETGEKVEPDNESSS